MTVGDYSQRLGIICELGIPGNPKSAVPSLLNDSGKLKPAQMASANREIRLIVIFPEPAVTGSHQCGISPAVDLEGDYQHIPSL